MPYCDVITYQYCTCCVGVLCGGADKSSVVDPELLPGSVSGMIFLDPDPAKNERADM